MKLIVYPLLKTTEGKVHGEFPVAEVALKGGETHILCPDGALREHLLEIFSTPIWARAPLGSPHGIYAWQLIELSPHTGDFFRAIPSRLRKFELYGVLEPVPGTGG